MPSGSNVKILPGEVAQIVESVFATMLGLKTSESGSAWFPSRRRLTAAVELAGVWNGAVTVECDPAQACQFAGRFLSIDTPDRVDDMVRDVLGELANMIGGNLKCVVSDGVRLSMPWVMDGEAAGVQDGVVSKPPVSRRLAFECAAGPFWVEVSELDSERGALPATSGPAERLNRP